MDFDYTEDQTLLRDMVGRFGKDSVEPVLMEMDESERISETLLGRMADLGLFGLAVPESFGGSGVPLLTQVVVAEALGRVSASLAAAAVYHSFLLPALLDACGDEAQKRRRLPGIASGETLGTVKVGAVSLEDRPAGAGEDGPPDSMICAAPEGEKWRLTGGADWVVNGRDAAVGAVFASTGDGVEAFLVNSAAAGVESAPITGKLGLRPLGFARWSFAECAVDGADKLDLGGPNSGDGVRRGLRLLSDLFLAAASVGLIQAGLEVAGEYAKERKQFDRPIGGFQLVQEMIAGMVFDVEAARLLVYRAAADAQGRGLRLEGSAAPIARARSFAAEAALKAGTQAVQVHGGYGFSNEYPAERIFRDARALALMAGGSGELLRLSAEPILKEALPQSDG